METSDLTDAQWDRLRPLLPPEKPPTGRPANDHCTVLNGILYVLRTGCPWRYLPERYGSWKTVSSRFYRWKAGVWDHLLAELQHQGTPTAGSTGPCISWTAPSSGRTSTLRGQRGDPDAEGLGRSRGGYSTKIHLRCERSVKPMAVVLTPGQRHEQPVLPTLMERGPVKRPGRGRPRVRPDRVTGDKDYSSPAVHRYLRGRRIGAVIPTRADEVADPAFDRAAYRERNVVERLINRLKQWRRIATRYGKRAANYQAMLTIAAVLQWL